MLRYTFLVMVIMVAATLVHASNPRVYIVSPTDGETVTSPLTVVFGLENFGVAPAGTQRDGTGHHHLLVNSALPPLDRPIPADDNHLHFGGGQTQAVLELPPGQHTLQLLMGDHYHIPHAQPLYSEIVTVTVE
jgi:hypothetical protein